MAEAPVKHWTETNVICKQMRTLQVRTKQVVKGEVKLLIIYGPPGIAKSETISNELREYSQRVKADWLSAKIKPERRTVYDEMMNAEFRPPFNLVTGRISFPQFHCAMFWAANRGEVFFIDDVASLADSRIQEAIQQASDPTHDGLVKYNFNADLPDGRVSKTYNMRGGLIIVTNFNKGDPASVKELKQVFSEPVRDRAVEVNFSWNKDALFEYVTKLGFIAPNPERPAGLYAYMIRPTAEEQPDLHESKIGPGFKGSPEEAAKMLRDVRSFFAANVDRADNISFRLLRKMISDRVLNPDIWQELAEVDHFKPRPPKDPKMDTGSTHAFIERPDIKR